MNTQRYYELLRILNARYTARFMGHATPRRDIVRYCEIAHEGCNASSFNGAQYATDKGDRWLHINLKELRVHESPKIDRQGTTGYYMDSWQDSVAIPLVIQFPSRKGKIITLAAFKDDSGSVCIDSSLRYNHTTDIETCVCDAAFTAHRMAERYAEESRDANAQQEAEHEIDLKLADVAEARAEHTAIVKELRRVSNCQYPLFDNGTPVLPVTESSVLCKAIRAQLTTLRIDVQRSIKRIKALRENYWLAVDC